MKTLRAFYRRSKKATYLPAAITTQIRGELTQINADLSPISIGADEPAPAADSKEFADVLQKMDLLYAYCLQYGLISFGFSGKVRKSRST